MLRAWLFALVCLLGAACTTLTTAPDASAPAPVRECKEFFAQLDAAVDRAGRRDAQSARIAGYPYLRIDRYLASFVSAARDDHDVFVALLREARRLDHDAREVELGNLADAERPAVPRQHPYQPASGARNSARATSERCADELQRFDASSAPRRAALLDRLKVPDDYLAWQRVLGLYAVTRGAVAAGIERWQREVQQTFRDYSGESRRDGHPSAGEQRYGPPAAATMSPEELAELLRAARRNPLQMLELDADQRDRLFATFAPDFEVERADDDDRIGALGWDRDHRPRVDPDRPVVYRRLAYTRYREQGLPQLVYTAWFRARPAKSSTDTLAGALDGILWRVTLGPEGRPLVYDSIHPCGCYHMFFPTASVESLAAPAPGDEWAFVPASAPRWTPGTRVRVRIASHTHYLAGLAADDAAPSGSYTFADEDELRSLPLPDGGRRSIYGPDALVAGSERLERWLLWPMGVPSAGTMRQWGHHATAFVGRRHFDDADLIERRFRIAD